MHTHTHAVDCAACLPCRLTDIVFYTWSTRQPSLCWRVSSGRWTWWFWETAARARNSFIANKQNKYNNASLLCSSPSPTPPHLPSAGGLWNWKMSLFYLFRGTHRRLFAYCWTKGKYQCQMYHSKHIGSSVDRRSGTWSTAGRTTRGLYTWSPHRAAAVWILWLGC